MSRLNAEELMAKTYAVAFWRQEEKRQDENEAICIPHSKQERDRKVSEAMASPNSKQFREDIETMASRYNRCLEQLKPGDSSIHFDMLATLPPLVPEDIQALYPGSGNFHTKENLQDPVGALKSARESYIANMQQRIHVLRRGHYFNIQLGPEKRSDLGQDYESLQHLPGAMQLCEHSVRAMNREKNGSTPKNTQLSYEQPQENHPSGCISEYSSHVALQYDRAKAYVDHLSKQMNVVLAPMRTLRGNIRMLLHNPSGYIVLMLRINRDLKKLPLLLRQTQQLTEDWHAYLRYSRGRSSKLCHINTIQESYATHIHARLNMIRSTIDACSLCHTH